MIGYVPLPVVYLLVALLVLGLALSGLAIALRFARSLPRADAKQAAVFLLSKWRDPVTWFLVAFVLAAQATTMAAWAVERTWSVASQDHDGGFHAQQLQLTANYLSSTGFFSRIPFDGVAEDLRRLSRDTSASVLALAALCLLSGGTALICLGNWRIASRHTRRLLTMATAQSELAPGTRPPKAATNTWLRIGFYLLLLFLSSAASCGQVVTTATEDAAVSTLATRSHIEASRQELRNLESHRPDLVRRMGPELRTSLDAAADLATGIQRVAAVARSAVWLASWIFAASVIGLVRIRTAEPGPHLHDAASERDVLAAGKPKTPVTQPTTGICAAHGLRYDPARATGCVLCKKLEAQQRSTPRSLPIGLLAASLVALAVGYWMFARAPRPKELLRVNPVASDKPGCVAAAAHWEEACNQACRPPDLMCRSDCLALLDARLWRCSAKLTFGAADPAGEIYATGPAPVAAVLRDALTTALAGWEKCDPVDPGMTFVHLEIDGATGKAKSVGVNATHRSNNPCVEAALARAAYPTAVDRRSDYAFLFSLRAPWIGRPAVAP